MFISVESVNVFAWCAQAVTCWNVSSACWESSVFDVKNVCCDEVCSLTVSLATWNGLLWENFAVYGPFARQSPWLGRLAVRGNLLNFLWPTLQQSPGLDRLAGRGMTVSILGQLLVFLWFLRADSLNTSGLLQGSAVCFSELVSASAEDDPEQACCSADWWGNSHCYVRQCWLITTLLLELPRGILLHISLIISSALRYTMLAFRFPYLHTIGGMTWLSNTKFSSLLQLYFSIFTIP